MFKKLTKFIVKQMDPSKDLVPVESFADNEHFRPLCLLIRKSKRTTIFHPAPYFQQTRLTLYDVLLPGEYGKLTELLQIDPRPFTITRDSTGEAEGGLAFSIGPVGVDTKGGASSSQAFSVTLQKESISQRSLEALSRKTRIKMDHSFIRQLQRTVITLHVVTEIFEASEEFVYKESTRADGGFRTKFYATFSAQGTKKEEQSIVIPKGCTLAFKAIQICIFHGTWDLDYIVQPQSDDDTVPQVPSKGILEVVMEEVKNYCRIFSELSIHLLLIVLNTIKTVMRDNNLLQELSQKMEELSEGNNDYELKTESPDLKNLFSTLQQSPRGHRLLLAEGITYILDAFHELMEDQLLLLLESLERKIVPQQLKLVANLLKHDLEKGKKPFRVDAGLLSFPHKEEQGLTMALVELSGVQLQEDGSAVPRQHPFKTMAALFVALYALNLLSGSE